MELVHGRNDRKGIAVMRGLCDCERDGFCPRYNRSMVGRFRQICQGVNVDLGTAAAFREQWTRESNHTPSSDKAPTVLLLKTDQAPGDSVAMTAAIHSLHQAYPGRFITCVESYWPDVFMHNPDVDEHTLPTGGPNPSRMVEVAMHYPAIHTSNERGIHFMQGWCEFLGAALNLPLPLLTNRPRLYFDTPTPPTEDFWLICSGGKNDFTTKLWGHERYQEVVDRLDGEVKFVQVGGSQPLIPWAGAGQEDNHKLLEGAVDLLGKTSLRQLFELVRRARGVVCGVSLLMHVAAALEKPAIVIAGGREPVQWNAYPKQHYLHTIGMTPCKDVRGREGGGCWRYRTLPLGDHPTLDRNTCERPIGDTPECLTMIQPMEVVTLIRKYREEPIPF